MKNSLNSEITLVLGGISSGKSAFAEGLVSNPDLRKTYIATGQNTDGEMARKIAAHQMRRGTDWATVEVKTDIAGALENPTETDVFFLDCATFWLSNVMFSETHIENETTALLRAFETCPLPLVVISNEVGLGGISDNAMARKFARLQGQLNQDIASLATNVILVSAGLPMILKGQIPEFAND